MSARPHTAMFGLAALLAAAPAHAQEAADSTEASEVREATEATAEEAPPPGLSDAARAALGRGAALFDRGHYEGALSEFLGAHVAMEGHPRRHHVLYNIALCYERLFRYERAIEFYRRFLDEGAADGARAEEVRSILDTLDDLLGRVRVRANVPALEVWIDGHRVSEGGDTVRLPAGTHTVEVRAAGHLPARREANVRAGEESVVAITLEAIDAYRGLPREFFFAGVGLTAVTLGVAVGVGLEAMADWRALELRLASPTERWEVTPDEHAAQQRLSLVADVFYGVTGLLAIATLVVGLLTDFEDGPDRSEPGLAIGPAGVRGWF